MSEPLSVGVVGLMLSEVGHDRYSADLVGAARSACERMILNEGGMETGIIFLVTAEKVGFIHFPLHDPRTDEALALVEFIRDLLKQHGAHSYAMCSEAWIRMGGKEMLQDGRSAGEYPDRMEAVSVVGETGGSAFAHCYEMLRDEAGSFLGLGDDILARPGEVPTAFGLWTGLLASEVRH